MSVVGKIFEGIGNLLGGGSSTPQAAAIPAAPATPAPQQQAGSKTGTNTNMQPSFLAAAALPNQAASGQSNVGGKSLLGQ